MSLLDKMLRRQSRTEEPLHHPGAEESHLGSEARAVAPVLVTAPPATIASSTAPLPQDAARPYPQYQSQMQNTGMAVGAVTGILADGSAGSATNDMMIGGVVGGIVGQRLAQAENHAFWKGQAMEYREGRAAGVIPPPEGQDTTTGKASWWSKEGRAQRRAERWERRAKRRDGLEDKE